MKQSSCLMLRPIYFFIFLILMVLSLAGVLIPLWIKIENEVKLISYATNQELFSRINRTSALFSPLNASAINLATILSSSLDHNDLHFSQIKPKVAPALFQALSTVPYLSQISYIGLDGLFFAYYKQGDQPYALYSNFTVSSAQNDTDNYTWFLQSANRDNGKLYGEATTSPPSTIDNSSLFLQALRSRNGCWSVGIGFGDSQDMMLLRTVGLDGKGAISLGFPMKVLVDFLIDEVASHNGSLYLATMDGYVLTQGFPNFSCQSDRGKLIYDDILRSYVINCSSIEFAGMQLVYTLALPQNEFRSHIHKNIRLSFVLLILMIGGIVMTMCIFMLLIAKAARREMYLYGALTNQMEATRQSERKSMNKSLAFASASHDIRASLAGIFGLIEICRNEVAKRDPSRSEMVTNLLQMEACTSDLLGILNSILDTSKIEAGKMQLEEEEFDMEQLLEDVVDLYHPVGAKKGVDIILDPYDGSISKSRHIKGDRTKAKQILSNLLSNAVKFTSEGHVTVRAWARKPSFENEILVASKNNNISWSCLFCLLFEIETTIDEPNTMPQRDSNCIEFVFEVNDTGKGIPKEKQKSVFENFVQLKETMLSQEGTGLGLGIVQSLVRLMGGEIHVVDKEDSERGTCFRFNILLRASETGNASSTDIETNEGSFDHSHIQNTKIRRSQVLLFIQSAKRSTILRTFVQRLGIKVHVVTHHEQLSPTLKKIKQKLNLSRYSSSSGSEVNPRSDGYASSTRSKPVPLSALDGVENILGSGLFGFILMVIDTRAGPFREITRAVAEFRRNLNESCCSRVVWLDKPDANNKNFDDKLPASDFVLTKPFHGSRLYQTIKLLPEFGGILPRRRETQPRYLTYFGTKTSGEIEEVNNRKPLLGKKILLADDDPIGRKVAAFVASQLGADICSCENGEEAWKLVCKSLNERTNTYLSSFDYILMDCEMPVMDGSEATARIREEEKSYGVRTPVIALTAHNKGEEIERMIQAGVDAYITKPLDKDSFFKVISQLTTKL